MTTVEHEQKEHEIELDEEWIDVIVTWEIEKWTEEYPYGDSVTVEHNTTETPFTFEISDDHYYFSDKAETPFELACVKAYGDGDISY